jgi:peptidoglycan/LPS O-acetylase OafA/YrhL
MKATQTSLPTGAKIAEFDILRSAAILLLFCHHGGIYNFTIAGFSLRNLDPFIEYFLLGAFVFMAGYLSVHSLNKSSLPSFLFSKVVRIYIPYLLALALFITILNVKLSGLDLAIHLFGGQMLLSPRFTSPVLTLWFIGVILVYYSLFAVLYKSTRLFPAFVGMALLAFLLAFYARLEWEIITRRFFFYYLVYLAGVICAHTGGLARLTSARFFLVDKILLAGAGIGVLNIYRSQVNDQFSLALVLAIDFYILSILLLALGIAALIARHWRGVGIFSTIADASFFAYLFHRPIWAILLEIYPANTAEKYFIYLVLLGSVLVLGISYALQHAYNVLAHKVQRRIPVGQD